MSLSARIFSNARTINISLVFRLVCIVVSCEITPFDPETESSYEHGGFVDIWGFTGQCPVGILGRYLKKCSKHHKTKHNGRISQRFIHFRIFSRQTRFHTSSQTCHYNTEQVNNNHREINHYDSEQ